MRLRTLLKPRMIFFSAWMFSSMRRSALMTSAETSPRCTRAPPSSSEVTANLGSSSLRTARSLLGSSATTWTGIRGDTFRDRRGGPARRVPRDPAPDDRSRPPAWPKTSRLLPAAFGRLPGGFGLLLADLRSLLARLELHEADAGVAAVDPDQLAAPEGEAGRRQQQEELLGLQHVDRALDLDLGAGRGDVEQDPVRAAVFALQHQPTSLTDRAAAGTGGSKRMVYWADEM